MFFWTILDVKSNTIFTAAVDSDARGWECHILRHKRIYLPLIYILDFQLPNYYAQKHIYADHIFRTINQV